MPISLVPSSLGVLAPAAWAAYAMSASRSSSARSDLMALRLVSELSRMRRHSRYGSPATCRSRSSTVTSRLVPSLRPMA